MLGSFSDYGWAGPGDLTQREPPAEICLFRRAWALDPGRVTSQRKDPLLLARAWNLKGES